MRQRGTTVALLDASEEEYSLLALPAAVVAALELLLLQPAHSSSALVDAESQPPAGASTSTKSFLPPADVLPLSSE